jgi:two-component system, response regulator / RNA-binding antiterminator
VAATRTGAEALAQRLEEATAALRATFAGIRQSRPRHEILRHSAFARMRAKLDTMPVIEQAKGIIMAQSDCSQDEAFELLRRASQRTNVPVRELAAQIVAKTFGGRPAEPGNDGGQAASSPPRTVPARQARPASGDLCSSRAG